MGRHVHAGIDPGRNCRCHAVTGRKRCPSKAFRQAKSGDIDAAYETFSHVSQQIVFSLQSMELLHHTEKRLLHARGILRAPFVRVRASNFRRTRNGISNS